MKLLSSFLKFISFAFSLILMANVSFADEFNWRYALSQQHGDITLGYNASTEQTSFAISPGPSTNNFYVISSKESIPSGGFGVKLYGDLTNNKITAVTHSYSDPTKSGIYLGSFSNSIIKGCAGDNCGIPNWIMDKEYAVMNLDL